jgi:hypothetical protein
MRKITCGIASWPFAAIHIDRPADDQAANALGVAQAEHGLGIRGEFLPPEDFQGACHNKGSVGNGEANGLLADIKAEEPLAAGKRCRHIVKLADRHMR